MTTSFLSLASSSAMRFGGTPEEVQQWTDQFTLGAGETLASVLAGYDEVAARTTEIVAACTDLDASQPLPA